MASGVHTYVWRCHEGTTSLTFLPWNEVSEGENSDFLVFNIVARVYCFPCRQEFHKCNTGLILWFFLLATTFRFFIDVILSVAAWILVQNGSPSFYPQWQMTTGGHNLIYHTGGKEQWWLLSILLYMHLSTFGAPYKHWPWNSLALQYLTLHYLYQWIDWSTVIIQCYYVTVTVYQFFNLWMNNHNAVCYEILLLLFKPIVRKYTCSHFCHLAL